MAALHKVLQASWAPCRHILSPMQTHAEPHEDTYWAPHHVPGEPSYDISAVGQNVMIWWMCCKIRSVIRGHSDRDLHLLAHSSDVISWGSPCPKWLSNRTSVAHFHGLLSWKSGRKCFNHCSVQDQDLLMTFSLVLVFWQNYHSLRDESLYSLCTGW